MAAAAMASATPLALSSVVAVSEEEEKPLRAPLPPPPLAVSGISLIFVEEKSSPFALHVASTLRGIYLIMYQIQTDGLKVFT